MYKKYINTNKYTWIRGVILKKIGTVMYLISDWMEKETHVKRHVNQIIPLKEVKVNTEVNGVQTASDPTSESRRSMASFPCIIMPNQRNVNTTTGERETEQVPPAHSSLIMASEESVTQEQAAPETINATQSPAEPGGRELGATSSAAELTNPTVELAEEPDPLSRLRPRRFVNYKY